MAGISPCLLWFHAQLCLTRSCFGSYLSISIFVEESEACEYPCTGYQYLKIVQDFIWIHLVLIWL